MHRLLFCTLVTLLMFVSCSEKISKPVSQTQIIEQKFPDSWTGTWVGELGIYRGTKKLQAIPMEVVISPKDSVGHYDWKTTYSGQQVIEKPYKLITLDATKGTYLIDEHNSIKIEAYLFDNKLVSWYVVEGNIILATNELRGDQMIFEILAGNDKPASITGGVKDGEEDISEVTTWPVNVMQRGILTRKK